MKLTGKIYNLVLSLWAVAILWICIGTLVNFHQHKIWGKPLLPELLYAKRDKEQTVDLVKLIKPDIPRDIQSWSFDYFNSVPPSPAIENSCLPIISYLKTADPVFPERFVLPNGLRAPPIS